MNWAHHYICKGKLVEIFHEGNTLPLSRLPELSCLYLLQAAPLTGGSIYGSLCVFSHFYSGKLKTSLPPGTFQIPPHKHILTQLSTVALNIIYCNCLFPCLMWFHPLNCEAGIAFYLLPHPKAVSGTQQTHNICCTFLPKIVILPPAKPLHSAFKTT